MPQTSSYTTVLTQRISDLGAGSDVLYDALQQIVRRGPNTSSRLIHALAEDALAEYGRLYDEAEARSGSFLQAAE